MKKIFFSTVLSLTLAALPLGPAFAQTGNHYGEQPPLVYHIEYVDPLGITTADAGGITYAPFACCTTHEDTVLPVKYFGDYPLYFTNMTMNFRLTLTNNSPRTYRNLKIDAYEEFLNIAGGVGDPIGDNNDTTWYLDKLGAHETVVLSGAFAIPNMEGSGIDQTHLIIRHNNSRTNGTDVGEIILDNTQAGLWCPAKS